MSQSAVSDALDHFIMHTPQSKVAVIVPLFGFWNTVENNDLNSEILEFTLHRLHSSAHMLTIFLVADTKTLPSDVQKCIANISSQGNVKGVQVEDGMEYGDYIRSGFRAALEDHNQFVMFMNPWVMIQEGAVDTLIERTNMGDDAKIVCGYDFHDLLSPESFDEHVPFAPSEEHGLSFDFMCMPRYAAEMIDMDSLIKSHRYLERDLWQDMTTNGFVCIFTQRVPIFPFRIDWDFFEPADIIGHDRQRFIGKWGFDLA